LALKTAWSKYIIARVQGLLDFDYAIQRFQSIINDFFSAFPVTGRAAFAFFPSHLRTPIMQAGAEARLMRLTYDGVRRDVEPYSLAYKQRADGHREEYLYVYDRTGGRSSGPGLKSLFNHKIQDLHVLNECFEPRYPISLAKAGEFTGDHYFSKPFGSGRSPRSRTLRHGWRYTVQCAYCSRNFKRMRRDTILKPHKRWLWQQLLRSPRRDYRAGVGVTQA
jgi:hypothetical protein